MPITKEDLQVHLEILPDDKKVTQSLGKIATQMDAVSKKAGTNLAQIVDPMMAKLSSLGGVNATDPYMAALGAHSKAQQDAKQAEIAERIARNQARVLARGEQVAGLIPSVAGAVAGGVGGLGGGLGPVSAGFGAAQSGLGALSKTLSAIGPEAVVFSLALSQAVGPMESITRSLVDAAGVASPAALQQWNIALQDVQGVIGQTFVPVLYLMRDGVRFVGDVMATVLPSMSEMEGVMATMRPTLEELKASLTSVMEEFGPTMRTFVIASLWGLAQVLNTVARSAQAATFVLRYLIPGGGLFAGAGRQEMRSSQGAAARPSTIQGWESYQQQLQTTAFSTPSGIRSVESNTQSIAETAAKIYDWLQQHAPGGTTGMNLANAVVNPSQWAFLAARTVFGFR